MSANRQGRGSSKVRTPKGKKSGARARWRKNGATENHGRGQERRAADLPVHPAIEAARLRELGQLDG